jgi:hypothetical protein
MMMLSLTSTLLLVNDNTDDADDADDVDDVNDANNVNNTDADDADRVNVGLSFEQKFLLNS